MAFNKIAGAFVDQSLDNYLLSIKSNTSINDNLWYTYNNNSATPINGTGTSNTDAIPFGGPTGTVGRIYDTHGSMINGTFTAPVNGIYLVTSYINTNQTSSWVEVWINGSQNRRRFLVDSSGIVINSYIQLRLLAGQTLQLRPFSSFVVFGGTLDSGGTSQIEISRITL